MALENTDLFLIQDKDTKANYQVSYETMLVDLNADLNLDGKYVNVTGDDMSGNLTFNTNKLIIEAAAGRITGTATIASDPDNAHVTKGYMETYADAAGKWVEDSGTLFPKVAANNVAIGNTVGDPRIKFTAATGEADFDGMITSHVGSDTNAFIIRSANDQNIVSQYYKDAGDGAVLMLGDVNGTAGVTLYGSTGNGIFTGNVTADSFTGPVTGDITGNITGNINGNVNGDVTGNLTGDVTGDVTGNLTGDVTGNVNGNVTGDVTGDLTGNADTATKLKTARTIALSGDVSGSANFDGSSNITISSTVADDSHNHIISNVDGLQAALDSKLGTGDKAADSDKLDGLNSTQFLRSDTADTASGDITFTGGAGAVTIATGCDIRFAAESGWTGDAVKLQHHDNYLYMQAGSNGIIFRDSGGTNNLIINPSGNLQPNTNNAYDLGTVSNLFRRVYSYNYALESLPALP